MENKKFDVIVVAGQSNAEGNGLKKDKFEYLSDRVFQFIDKNNIQTRVLDNGKVVIDMVYPTETVFEKAHERVDIKNGPCADFSEIFANRYIENGMLDDDRNILIVKTAVGGTGFTRKEWGVGNILFARLNYMLDCAIRFSKESRIVAFLWHQGEHDAFENPEQSDRDRYDFYFKSFTEQIKQFRSKYGKNIPVIAGEFADSWAELSENKHRCDAVESALKDACASLGMAKVVSSEGLFSNDQVFGNGDILHFCGDSVYELGKRYFSAFSELKC